MNVTAQLNGIPECEKNAMRYLNSEMNVARFNLLTGARLVREWANDHITPINTGYMVNTSFDRNVMISPDIVAAEIVYTAPYAADVEANFEGFAHGYRYNWKHYEEIKYGSDHARKPEEQDHFLSVSVDLKKNEVFQLVADGARTNVSA